VHFHSCLAFSRRGAGYSGKPLFVHCTPSSTENLRAQLIQQAYAPVQVRPDDQKRIQHELFEIQKHPHAWGLVVPLLENPDPNVQFFGAHTAQLKIARDW
jgi:hypothetical protein